jgi:type II secretory pathway pseudopilin PulG
MKKTDTVTLALVGLLAGLVVASMLQCYRYVRSLNAVQALQVQGQKLQAQWLEANRNREIVRAMATDALEFSKKNSAIDPLLQQLDLKPKPAAPAAKPSAR